MARRRAVSPLRVFVNGRLVGTLRRGNSGAIDFQYARDWLDTPGAFPVSLSLPLREDRYVGVPVVNVFDNLLPDNTAVRRRIAERVGADGTDAYSMLAVLGHDCAGALQFLPDGIEPGPAGSTSGTPVSDDEVGDILGDLALTPLGVGNDAAFRISIAGAQEKTALLRRDGRWYKPTGTTATTHILKPQIGTLSNGIDLSNSVENEYFCLRLADALGVSAARAEIAAFGGRRALVVERFDRLWTRDGRLLRLPQEDCCQALSVPPTRKYQVDGGPDMRAVIGLLRGSDTPDADIAAFLRANVVFWLLGATDGHAKNFSVFITPGGRYRLTPAYDVLTAQPSLDDGRLRRNAFKLAMSVGRNRHYLVDDIAPRHFLQTADLVGVGHATMRMILGELAAGARAKAADVIATLPIDFPMQLVDSIAAAIERRVRLIERA